MDAPGRQGDRLSVQVDRTMVYAVAMVGGTIDIGTHGLLTERLTQALTPDTAALIVDVAGGGILRFQRPCGRDLRRRE